MLHIACAEKEIKLHSFPFESAGRDYSTAVFARLEPKIIWFFLTPAYYTEPGFFVFLVWPGCGEIHVAAVRTLS